MEEKTNYLVHHGVKGMKWGVRRFQNKDGSLTAAGRKKYGSSGGPANGRRYSGKELKAIRKEKNSKRASIERDTLTKNVQYKEYEKEAQRLLDKYELDADDGGGGNYNKYSRSELQRAGQKYWDLSMKSADIQEKAYDDAYKKANDFITNKYGTLYNNQEYYRAQFKGLAFVAAVGGIFIVPHLVGK